MYLVASSYPMGNDDPTCPPHTFVKQCTQPLSSSAHSHCQAVHTATVKHTHEGTSGHSSHKEDSVQSGPGCAEGYLNLNISVHQAQSVAARLLGGLGGYLALARHTRSKAWGGRHQGHAIAVCTHDPPLIVSPFHRGHHLEGIPSTPQVRGQDG